MTKASGTQAWVNDAERWPKREARGSKTENSEAKKRIIGARSHCVQASRSACKRAQCIFLPQLPQLCFVNGHGSCKQRDKAKLQSEQKELRR